MKNSDRIFVYLIGFALGALLVWMILARRTAREEAAVDPWVEHNAQAIAEGAEPLPEGVPESMRKGRIIDFGFLPGSDNPDERIWLLSFEESYPYVRVVEELETGQLRYMAADQITLTMAEGVDVTELEPMLDELGLRLRMFNRKEKLAVIGVVSTEIDAVPATVEAIQPWSDLFESAQPDTIRFQR